MDKQPGGRNGRSRTTRLFGVLVVLALGVGGALGATPAADAAEQGYGQYRGGFWHGNYYEPGSGYLYCLDEDRSEPLGFNTDYQGIQSSIAAAGGVNNLSGNVLAGINMLISTQGQTTDNAVARAVNDAIWIVASNYSTSDPLSNQFASQILSYVAPTNAGSGTVGMSFNVDPLNNYLGTVSITFMTASPASGVITLTNGVFQDTGSATRVGAFSTGQTFNVRGIPPTTNGAPYKISAAANFQATVYSGYAAQVGVWQGGGAGYQRLAGPGGPNAATMTLAGSALDPTSRGSQFLPQAATQVVSESLAVGEKFKDVLTFSVGTDDVGTTNSWFQYGNGTYAPILAKGTVYGPFTSRPVRSAAVPAGAPVAGQFSVTTTLAAGPTISYPVESDLPMTTAGYYVAVVQINRADQSVSSPAVQALIPDDYNFQDDFGQLTETSIVPFALQYSTQLSANIVGVGEQLTDRITPEMDGGEWLQDGGTFAPVALTGTWYFSETKPVRSAAPPVGAVVVGTQTATLTGPAQVIDTAPFQTPYQPGWVTVQWCATASIYVNGYCDDFGVPSETAQLLTPGVTTQAQEAAVPTGTVLDTATVTGPVPTGGLNLTFAGYLQPADVSVPTCTPATQVFTSSSPIAVTRAGDYPSEAFAVSTSHLGTIYWIETLSSPQGDALHVGTCGLRAETTSVAWPTVVTAASPGGTVGDLIRDVATVSGPVPPAGLNLTFAAYLQPPGATVPTCTPETQLFASSTPTRVSKTGEYKSEAFTVTAETIGTIYWIETVTLRNNVGGVSWTHVGECGLPNETTRTTPPLARTGSEFSSVPWVVGGGLLLVGLGLVVFWRRLRKVNRSGE